MKKKHLITSVAAIVGVVMLAAASIATYATSNGYSAAKNAAKNILNEDNLTLKAEVRFMVDGKEIENEVMLQKFDKNGLVKFNDGYIGSGSRRTMAIQDNMDVTFYDNDRNGIPNKDDRIYTHDFDDDDDIYNRIWLYEAKDSKEAQSMIRFAELLTDTLVGDLKNNIILTDSTDETDTYTLSLDSYQIPELYQAGFEMMVASNSRFYTDAKNMSEEEYYKLLSENESDIGLMFEKDPKISSAEANVVMDKDGRLRNVNGSILFEGLDYFNKVHTVEMSLDIEAYDYGTTVCDRIDVAAAIDAGASTNIGYNLEKELESMAERMKDMEANKEKYGDEEFVQEQIENYRTEYESLQKRIDSPEYARYKEILNELFYGTPSDEERKALVDEKTQIVKSRVLDHYYDGDIVYAKEAASVAVIGGEDGPTAIVVGEDVPAEEVTD